MQRPLRVLFLGQVILRKGIIRLLEAAQILRDQPVEFWIVGPLLIDSHQWSLPNVRWLGSVPRSATAQYYQQADVFLFPTLSDGFGLTQLEAQAWQLPLIASQFCGDVVKDQVNGLVLSDVSGVAIAQAIAKYLQAPKTLKQHSENSTASDFPLHRLSTLLDKIVC
jgi:glycosyltransferase involved in cell wall biosynthesis